MDKSNYYFIGDKQVKRLRSFNIYRYLCSLLDSLSTLFLYSISLIIPNIVSGILFAFFSNNSLVSLDCSCDLQIVQIGINVVGSLCLLLCVLRCIPSKQLFREFKTDCNRVVSFSFIRTLPLYIPMLLIIVWNLRYVHLFPRAFSSILVSPIIEELVFRGYLCNVLSDRLNPILGMTFSSLCFSVLHLYSFSISDSFIIFINRVYIDSVTNGIGFIQFYWRSSLQLLHVSRWMSLVRNSFSHHKQPFFCGIEYD